MDEADAVIGLLQENGLERGRNGLRVIMMCEIPSNAVLADQFLERFDGFSIGSNDMTQFTLGLDRDSAIIADLFDERDEAVKAFVVLAEGENTTAEDIAAFCTTRLAGFKVPTVYEFRESLPKTSVGKIEKKALRQ